MVKPSILAEVAPSLFPETIPEHRPAACADRLVADYQYLCRRGARKFWRAGLEHCDLEQVAAIGLIKASRRFEQVTSTPFEAYAWLMIVGELMHYVRDHERAVRVPRRLRMLEPKFRQAHDVCSGRFGREPSDAELAGEMGLLPHAIAELRRVHSCATMLPLDDPGARDIASPNAIAIEDRLLVQNAFARLSLVERRVVVGIYLLGLSQLELARALGLPARRISRVRHAALMRMQKTLAS